VCLNRYHKSPTAKPLQHNEKQKRAEQQEQGQPLQIVPDLPRIGGLGELHLFGSAVSCSENDLMEISALDLRCCCAVFAPCVA